VRLPNSSANHLKAPYVSLALHLYPGSSPLVRTVGSTSGLYRVRTRCVQSATGPNLLRIPQRLPSRRQPRRKPTQSSGDVRMSGLFLHHRHRLPGDTQHQAKNRWLEGHWDHCAFLLLFVSTCFRNDEGSDQGDKEGRIAVGQDVV
jgi:hypothetical protein